MKYLWIEDFDCKNGENFKILKANWICQLGISEQNLIIFKNLYDGLTFIRDNPSKFDCVLLDIRFPVNNGKQENLDVYNEFFIRTLTNKYFDDKSEKATGLLAFNYLIYSIRFPINRIAFLSANIENKLDYPKLIKEALEYEKLDSMKENLIKYARRNFNEPEKTIKIEEIKEFISKEHVQNWIISNVNIVEGANSETKLTYNEAVKSFEEIGLILKYGYAKTNDKAPNIDFKKHFIKSNSTVYIEVRRAIIEMCLILEPYFNKEKSFNILNENLLNIDESLKSFYGKCYYQNLVKSLLLLPLEIRDDNISNSQNKKLSYKLIKKEIFNIVSSLEAFNNDKLKSNKEYCILKLTRNWTAHSVLKDDSYTPEFLAFIIYIAFEFYFDFDKLESGKKEFQKYNNILCDKFKKIIQDVRNVELNEDVYSHYRKKGNTCREEKKKLNNKDLFQCYKLF